MTTPTRDELLAALGNADGQSWSLPDDEGKSNFYRHTAEMMYGKQADAVLALLAAPPAPAPSSDEGRDELAELLAARVGGPVEGLTDAILSAPWLAARDARVRQEGYLAGVRNSADEAGAWPTASALFIADKLRENADRIDHPDARPLDAQPCNRAACRCDHPKCGDDREDLT